MVRSFALDELDAQIKSWRMTTRLAGGDYLIKLSSNCPMQRHAAAGIESAVIEAAQDRHGGVGDLWRLLVSKPRGSTKFRWVDPSTSANLERPKAKAEGKL